MVDIFGRGIVVPGGLADATDATLMKVAKQTGKNSSEIRAIDAELRKLRAEAKKTGAMARRSQGANASTVAAGTATTAGMRARGSQAGVSAGPVAVRGGRIAINSRSLRMGTGAFVAMGVLGAVGGAFEQWGEQAEVRQRYGTGEALGRIGRDQLRGVFQGGAEGLARSISQIMTGTGGDGRGYMQRFKQLFQRDAPRWTRIAFPMLHLLEETEAQQIERKTAETKALNDARRLSTAFVNAELEAIAQYRPKNVTFRTDEDVAAMRRMMTERDGGAIAEDASKVSKAILQRAGLLPED